MSYFPQGDWYDYLLLPVAAYKSYKADEATVEAHETSTSAEAEQRAAADKAVAYRLAHPTYNLWSEWFGKGAAAAAGEKKPFPMIPVALGLGLVALLYFGHHK